MSNKLTVEEVRRRVTAIRDDSDAETSHRDEDLLHFEFFAALAANEIKLKDAKQMAAIFLAIREMTRWYA